MYDELVKRLKEEADCPDNYPEDSCLMREAADAIEEICALCANQSKDCSEAIAKYLELWEKQPRWIPVTPERLPDYNEDVLVYANGLRQVRALIKTITDINYWEDEYGDWADFNDVEYWQPLPEPPKEDTNE